MAEWCKTCGKPVRRAGGQGALDSPLDKVVHRESGSETGPDGHLALPVATDPAMAGVATRVQADYAPHFNVRVCFNFYRADWRDAEAVTRSHVEADNEKELRARLDAMLRAAGLHAAGTLRAAGEGR